MIDRLFLPSRTEINFNEKSNVQNIVKEWYKNFFIELKEISFNEGQLLKIKNQKSHGPSLQLNYLKKKFFFHHYVRTMATVIFFLFKKNKNITILDLGCGTGSQSLLFSFLGANVISLDIDEEALNILKIRKKYYEKKSNRILNITICNANALKFNFKRYGPYDGIYSLFAFDLIQPTTLLLNKICPNVKPNGFFIIQTANLKSWFNRLFKLSRALSKEDLYMEFQKRNFFMESIGCFAIPSIFWELLPQKLIRYTDSILVKSSLFAISYLHIAKRI